MSLTRQLIRLFSRFMQDRTGSVMILFAAFVAIALAISGGAIDLSRRSAVRTHLQMAADAAALAAAKDPYGKRVDAMKLGRALFNSTGSGPLAGDGKIKFSLRRTADATTGISKATVVATMDMPTFVLSYMGFKTLPIRVEAVAGEATFETAVYALVDMSASMGLAADEANRAKMEAYTATRTGGTLSCAFACHILEGWEPEPVSTYQYAKDGGILLREDNLRDAFNNFLNTYMDPMEPSVAANMKKMAVVGFSDNAMMLQAPTAGLSELKSSLARFPNNKRVHTRHDIALAELETMMGAQGNGAPGNPKKMVLLITDGVQWVRTGDPKPNGVVRKPDCQKIKAKGFPITVLDVKYQENKGEYWFETHVRPFFTDIPNALKDCGSPGMYFTADDGDMKSLRAGLDKVGLAMKSQLSLSK